ncbi:Uncharacterised protein [Enterobacter cancerogenus]|uniref:Uncharacterized protein n=1 Tax=Enterobacter cancerogenus TaxID=69218 RepID=A0A484Z4Q5_9ENTR|nr:Uncharacterised protein [Enterobacter cancerogenus]
MVITFFVSVIPAFFQHRSKLCAVVNNLLHGSKVVQQDHAVGVFDGFPAQDLLILQVHQAFDDLFPVQQGEVRLAGSVDPPCR